MRCLIWGLVLCVTATANASADCIDASVTRLARTAQTLWKGSAPRLSVVQAGVPQAAQPDRTPLTADQIVAVIGSEADARAVMTMVLREAFPPGDRPRTEFVLRSQVRDAWLPKSKGVEIVQLSEGQAAARFATCGTYLVLSVQKRNDGVIRVNRQAKCSASIHRTDFAIRDGQWREVASGIGSGWVGTPPAECLRCVER